MIAYIFFSVIIANKLIGKNEIKENSIKKINIYLLIKLIMNFLIAHLLTIGIMEVMKKELRYIALLPAVISFLFSVIDSISLYNTIKLIRDLKCERKEYYFQIVGDNVLLYIAWIATSLLHVFRIYDNDYFFMLGYFGFWCFFNYAIIHIRKYMMKCKPVSNISLIKIVNKYNIEGYNIFEYDGKTRKSANAMVDCMFGKGNIYFSDYLLDELTEDEIEAIYLHEIGHIRKKHITIRNILLLMIMPIMSLVGSVMDKIERVQPINKVIGIMVGMGILIGYMIFFYLYISRQQEYEADKYSAEHIKDVEELCKALTKLNELNDILEQKKKSNVIRSHPTLEQRINRLQMYMRGETKK